MKAEERHEMQTNSLAVFLIRLPELLKEHSTKVLLVIALILLAIAGYRYKIRAEDARQMSITQDLVNARLVVADLTNRAPGSMSDDEVKTLLNERINQTRSWISEVLDDATHDPVRAANAQLTLGDLYARAASFQKGVDQQKSLEQAEAAYNLVFSKYKDQTQIMRNAHLGLAGVYSARGDAKGAAEQYNAIKNSDDFTFGDKMLADQGLSRLKDLEHPLLLLPATQPVIPSTQPTTQATPATQAAPTTQP